MRVKDLKVGDCIIIQDDHDVMFKVKILDITDKTIRFENTDGNVKFRILHSEFESDYKVIEIQKS